MFHFNSEGYYNRFKVYITTTIKKNEKLRLRLDQVEHWWQEVRDGQSPADYDQVLHRIRRLHAHISVNVKDANLLLLVLYEYQSKSRRSGVDTINKGLDRIRSYQYNIARSVYQIPLP